MAEMRTIKKWNPSSDNHQLVVGGISMARIALGTAMLLIKAYQGLGKKKLSLYLSIDKRPILAGVNALAEFRVDTHLLLKEPRHRIEYAERRNLYIHRGRLSGNSRKKRVPVSCRVKGRRSNFSSHDIVFPVYSSTINGCYDLQETLLNGHESWVYRQ
jgi:hypothetical protein